jgi:hypothetical protein
MFSKHRDYYGVDNDNVLVVNGSTEQFNPSIDRAIIAQAERDDPPSAAAEYGGMFRNDLASFLDDEIVDAAIEYARPLELPPRSGIKYHAFVDASAGRHDAFTMAIVHAETPEDPNEPAKLIADVVRGIKAPFNPASAAVEFAGLAKSYGISQVTGDCYAGAWVSTAFEDAGMSYRTSPLPKSALYLEGFGAFDARARVDTKSPATD